MKQSQINLFQYNVAVRKDNKTPVKIQHYISKKTLMMFICSIFSFLKFAAETDVVSNIYAEKSSS